MKQMMQLLRRQAIPVSGRADETRLSRTLADVTSSKEAEDRLLYQAGLLENVSEAIISVDLEFRIRTWNAAAEVMYGWRAEEVIGREVAEVISTSYPRGSREEARQELYAHGVWQGEVVQRRKDGTEINVQASITLMSDSLGKPTGMVGINRDISDRKAAERRLLEEKRLSEAIVDNLPGLFFMMDDQDNLVRWNSKQEEVLGYSSDELMTMDPILTIAPEDRSQMQAALAKAWEVGWAENEPQLLTKDGRRIPYVARGVRVSLGDTDYLVGMGFDDSERARAKEALRLSEERWRTYIEQADDLIFSLDANGLITMVNRSVQKVLGYVAEELLGQSSLMLVAPESQELATSFLVQVLAGTQVDSVAVEVLAKGGARIILEIRGTALFDGDQVSGSFHIARDITQRVQAQAALLESEQRYRALYVSQQRQARELELLDRVRTALAPELDLDTVFRTVVEAITEVFGYTLVSLYLLEGDILVLRHQVGYDKVIPRVHTGQGVMGEVVRTGQPILLENVRTHPQFLGAIEGILSEVCVPLFDRGQVVGTLNVESKLGFQLEERDLKLMIALSEHVNLAIERARLYTEVRKSEKRFRALIENSTASVTLLDAQDRILYTSPATSRVLGYDPEQFLGFTAVDFIHPQDFPRRAAAVAEVMANPDSPVAYRVRVRHKDGSWRWIDAVISNLLHEPGVEALVVNFRDVTEDRRAEEALRQAQKLESLGVMSGGIAHDFNNLLTAMLAQSSLACLKLPAASEARVHIDKITRAAEQAANLTRQLLAYSGRAQFEMRPLDLNAAIQDSLHLVSMAVAKQIRIISRLTDSVPMIEGDSGQIKQVVVNLVINAAEAIGDREGQVWLRTRVVDVKAQDQILLPYAGETLAAGRYAVLEVQDEGAGIGSETMARIFDPFFTTKATGRGLGLAAVLGIVRGHRGALQVESTPGTGTTFRLYFPVSDSSPISLSEQQAEAVSGSIEGLVLVIDDEAMVREVVVGILETQGIESIVAADGASGLALFQEHQAAIRLVLLDLSMPGLSGRETLQRLRALDPTVPVVVSSGYSEEEVGVQLADLGPIGFLQKPYDRKHFLRSIEVFLG